MADTLKRATARARPAKNSAKPKGTPVRALGHPGATRTNIPTAALVEELRAASEGRRQEQQLGFFGPYSELSFDEKVDFYRHAGKWTNRMILGDSLLVMTSLAEKEGLKGQVQTVHLARPYQWG